LNADLTISYSVAVLLWFYCQLLF